MSVSRSSKVPAHNVEPSLTRSSRTVVRRRSPAVWMLPSRTESTCRSRPAATGSRPGTVYFCTAPVERTGSSFVLPSLVISASAIPSPRYSPSLVRERKGSTAIERTGGALVKGVGRFPTQAKTAAMASAARTIVPTGSARARRFPGLAAFPADAAESRKSATKR